MKFFLEEGKVVYLDDLSSARVPSKRELQFSHKSVVQMFLKFTDKTQKRIFSLFPVYSLLSAYQVASFFVLLPPSFNFFGLEKSGSDPQTRLIIVAQTCCNVSRICFMSTTTL